MDLEMISFQSGKKRKRNSADGGDDGGDDVGDDGGDDGGEDDEAAKPFDYKGYELFCKSFHSNVAKSVGGTMGELYSDTYRGIFKIFVNDDEVQGTAFLICKSKHVSLLLTCAHVFSDWDPAHSIQIMSSDFKCFNAEVCYRSENMDLCVIVVKNELGSLLELDTCCEEINFGQDIFSISCPIYEMNLGKSLPPPNFDKKCLHTLWFSLTRGFVSHPFLVGIHVRNLDGTYLQLQGGNWGPGASGAPIFDLKGRVIGMFVGSTSDESVNNWALRLNSVRDYLDNVSKGGKSLKEKNSLRDVLWSLWKCTQSKAIQGRKKNTKKKRRRMSMKLWSSMTQVKKTG